ncbi:MAG: phosphoenolpyruvate--protein phosphotransferase, partial [bacterium]|nr:phosphoenolpyruvate--protein phosphotransferase [bacterium]
AAEPGDTVIVDGRRGLLIVRPNAKTLARYQEEASRDHEIRKGLSSFKEIPAVTLDGVKVRLQGNIELPEEVKSVLAYGAEGIGLYRTEYLYMMSSGLPDEEEQAAAYSRLAEQVAPHPLVVRTLDLGGDKLSSVLNYHTQEMNPFLGWRAIRLTLANRDLFRAQLRAILRASVHGNVRLMYPMISGVEELAEANGVLEEARVELRAQGVPFDEHCQVGAMIEVPSAAVVADLLAISVDFFSIGTNDLIQYTIAVDRGNERVAYLFDPFHPAVLRLIKSVADAGHGRGIPVTLCGEMAGDPWCGILLLGLGVDGFSMSPRAIPEVKRAIRSISMETARKLAKHALSLSSGTEIRRYLQEAVPPEVREVLPEPQFLEIEPDASSVAAGFSRGDSP